MSRESLGAALTEGFREVLNLSFESYVVGAEVLRLAAQLAAEKYGTEAWNRRR